jgi:hypothetical protein
VQTPAWLTTRGRPGAYSSVQPAPALQDDSGCPACEPPRDRVRVRSIQYSRTTSLRVIATLATPWCFLWARRLYARAHPASPLTALTAACTMRNRKKLLPCLVMAPSRRRCPLESSRESNPCRPPLPALAENARLRPASTPWPSPPPDPLPDASSATALPATAPPPPSPPGPAPRSVFPDAPASAADRPAAAPSSDYALKVLKRYNAAFCIYELAGYHSPLNITAGFTYVRLHGPEANKYQGSYNDDRLRWCPSD